MAVIMKSQRNYSKRELTRSGDLTVRFQTKWTSLQKQIPFRRRTDRTNDFLIANDNWAEYTLRYVVGIKKKKIYKTELFTKNLN
jgi:hypothetical protein